AAARASAVDVVAVHADGVDVDTGGAIPDGEATTRAFGRHPHQRVVQYQAPCRRVVAILQRHPPVDLLLFGEIEPTRGDRGVLIEGRPGLHQVFAAGYDSVGATDVNGADLWVNRKEERLARLIEAAHHALGYGAALLSQRDGFIGARSDAGARELIEVSS